MRTASSTSFRDRPGAVRRPSGLAVAVVTAGLCAAGLVASAGPAAATATCSNETPTLGTTVTCTTAGTDTITVPAGTAGVVLSVIGGGGGAGAFSSIQSGGGSGAVITGTATLPVGTATVSVVVGGAGSAGSRGTDGGGGGGGGGGSAIYAYDSGSVLLATLAVAGGGGGSGGADIYQNPPMASGAGGDAGGSGIDGGYAGLFTGGGGAAASGVTGGAGGGGAAGAGGTSPVAATAGGNQTVGTIAAGGVGSSDSHGRHGANGGSGYAGGGGGGSASEGSSTQMGGGGGGGGSSYIDPTYFPAGSSAIATSGAGVGANHGGSYFGGSGAAGAAGAITLTFAPPPPTITSVSPGTGPIAGGGNLVITGTHFTGATVVRVGGNPCASFTVDSVTQITCVLPAGVSGTANVQVTAGGTTATQPAAYNYLDAPANVTVAAGDSTARLSFQAPSDVNTITRYDVSLDGGATWNPATASTSGAYTLVDLNNLVNGTTYPVELRAVDAGGIGSVSTMVSVTPSLATTPAPDAPQAPSAPSAVAGTASVTVSWSASPSDGVTGYTVTASPGPATCSTTTETSCVLGAVTGTTYVYTVVAHSADAGDSTASAPSNQVTPTDPTVPVTAPTDAPTTLTTTDGQLSKVELSQPVTVVGTGFAPFSTAKVIIYSDPILLATVTTDGSGDFTAPVVVPADLEVGAHNFVASGVDPAGATRQLRMPVTVSATTFKGSAPTKVTPAAGDGRLVVSFNPAVAATGTSITGYQVSVDDGKHWKTVTTTGTTRLQATLTGLTNGATYSVRVRALILTGTTAGTGMPTAAVKVSLTAVWFRDPVSASARKKEIAIPADPAAYKGAEKTTRAAYRSHNNTLAVPAAWARGHALTKGEAATLTGDGLFAFNSPVITKAGTTQLKLLAKSLTAAGAITCEGYSDYAGSAGHEKTLSARRAQAVCAALRSFGVKKATLRTVGYGRARPVTVGGSARARAANRRVVVLVTK